MGVERQTRPRSKSDATRTDAARSPVDLAGAMAALSSAIGNRAMGALLQRAPASIPMTTLQPSAVEITAAEAWVTYLANRGRSAKPTVPVPDRYQGPMQEFEDAVFGAQDEQKKKPLSNAKYFLKTLRQMHDEVLKTPDHKAFELADVALKRAGENVKHQGEDSAFGVEGATELDYARTVNHILGEADDEVTDAVKAGYRIPEALGKVSGQARAKWEAASKTWDRGAPSGNKFVSATDEADLVKFRDQAMAEIQSMRALRARDEARYRRAEAEALEIAAEKHMTELRAMMADRRRALFMAGKKGDLRKLQDAVGEVLGVVDEMKSAANIITSRVDTLNKIAEYTTSSGGKLVNLPELPKGLTGVADKIKDAHAKLGKILDLLDLVGPAKTNFDDGVKYLKGLDMSLDYFGGKAAKGNPFISVYVNGYLRPGIQHCIEQLGKIAGIISEQNRAAIGAGHPEWVMNWNVEPGGSAVYVFLAQLYKVGGAAQIGPTAWAYFQDHDDDLEAAVGEALPKSERAVGAWGMRNRAALWETFYGSTTPPR